MLVGFKRIIFSIGLLYPCIWTSLNADPIHARPKVYVLGSTDSTDICINQAACMQECLDVDQLIVMIVQIRDFMMAQGYQFPRLTHILDACRDVMMKDGIRIDDADIRKQCRMRCGASISIVVQHVTPFLLPEVTEEDG